MANQSYKQMLIESLIDISSMNTYKSPADKVLNAKDEKYETFRSATSEVDVLGRAYAGQDDWDNSFITETADMDETNQAQGEPDIKVDLPDGHDPDITDLEDNIDESDPDKNYQEPITSKQDAKEQHMTEGADDPAETTEDDEDEDSEDDSSAEDDTEITTEGDEDLGDDLPEDEPIEDEPVDNEPAATPEEDVPATDDEDLGEDLPEDEPIEDEPVGDELDEGDEDLGEDLSEDDSMDDDGVPAEDDLEDEEDLGEDLPEDDANFQAEDDSLEQEDDEDFAEDDLGEDLPEDDEVCPECGNVPCTCEEPDEDDVITDEPSDIDSASKKEDDEVTPPVEEGVGLGAVTGAVGGALTPVPGGAALGAKLGAAVGGISDVLKHKPINAGVEHTYGNALMEDVTMDPNANLGAAPVPPQASTPAAPVDPNAVPADPNAQPPVDPNTGAPVDPNAQPPADPNTGAPVDPNDPNAQVPEGEGENPEEQDPILDVDSNVVASDTSVPSEEDNQQPIPTQESIMESLISELGSYADNGSTFDMKDLLSQDIDD